MKPVERQGSRTDGPDASLKPGQPGAERQARQRGSMEVERKPDREQLRKTILDQLGVATAAEPPINTEEGIPGRKLRWLSVVGALGGLLVVFTAIWFYLYVTSLNLGD